MVSLHSVHRFGIAEHVPQDHPVSYPQLAHSTGLEPELLKRLIRHAATHRVFREPQKGFVQHTATSKLLLGSKANSWMGVGCEEMWPAALKTVEAMDKWPGSQEPNETGFALANQSTESMYQVLESDRSRAKRFGEAMSLFASNKGMEPHHILDNYDWETIVGSGLVVDLGGNRGQVAIPLAQRFPLLHVLVQDLENVVHGAEELVPENIRDRVKFMAHDFFTEQKVRAKVYYIRWCLHNWSDKYAIKILRCLIPTLEEGARVIVHDSCIPEREDMPRWRERRLRAMDINMLSILNARERDIDEWELLFRDADPRFEFQGVKRSEGSNLAIMEAIWRESVPGKSRLI
ncbi:hypothetical protein ACLMJK_009564 [Lecanora helva]